MLAEHKAPVYATGGLSLVTSSVRRFPPDCLDPKIHHNNLIQSILAKIEANVAGADDALMLDQRGFIAETNATHVFIVERRLLRTPRLVACPEGITRATVLELCRAHGIAHEEVDLTLTEVYCADEMFCTGTMGELAAVTKVDGRHDRRRPARTDDATPVGVVPRAHGARRNGRRRPIGVRPLLHVGHEPARIVPRSRVVASHCRVV